MSKYKNLVAVFFSLFIGSVGAVPEVDSFPTDMMFADKSIDSLCFADWEDSASLVYLNNCGITKLNYTLNGVNDALINKGFIGYDWTDAKNQSNGYSYYKFFSAEDHFYWIYTINNSGGSGHFTAIDLVKRKNPEQFKIEEIVSGDRCNGGIQDVEEHNKHLSFSINLTPYDFLTLAHDNSHQLKALEDLSACATCCTARAYYEVDINSDPKLKYVNIGKRSTAKMPDQGLYQGCFNRLLSAYISKGELQFDDTKLKAFVSEFNQACVKRM